jgi:DNA-binding NtrC family response regulator
MDNLILAVLMQERPDAFEALKGALSDMEVEAYSVQGCNEAKSLIAQYHPLLVFVDLPIWNKFHADIVRMAQTADQTFNIIVLGPAPDIEAYASAIERGAFNFVAPPFSREPLTRIVYSAAMDARERTEAQAREVFAHAAG